jgi:pimeloyl-ACP methyl ester carboxylesterase
MLRALVALIVVASRRFLSVTSLRYGLVTPWEIPRLIRANNVSLEVMNEELLGLDLRRSVPSLDVPIMFFLGRYDRHTDARIAAAYLDNLHTPVKRLVWFDKSAHNVPFEEPALFNATVVSELRRVGIRPANDKPASLRAPVVPQQRPRIRCSANSQSGGRRPARGDLVVPEAKCR